MNRWIVVCGLALTVLASAAGLRNAATQSGVIITPPGQPGVIITPPGQPGVIITPPGQPGVIITPPGQP